MINYLYEKVQDGVIDLSVIPTHKLKQMVSEVERQKDRDLLGCEIMYRKEK